MRATLLSHGFRSCCFQPTANDAPPTYFFTPKTNASRLTFRASLGRNMTKRRDFVSLPPDVSPRSSGTDACANPLRPLPSPDLLAELCVQECSGNAGCKFGSTGGRKLFRKTTRRRDSSKRPHPNEPVLRSRYAPEKFEFLKCLSPPKSTPRPEKVFF